ncbi:MAG: extracellular solute-binding protein [Spirochaetales bacterium]|nr:extracellular solute-binding protein [Spirochaetales bacterium]
MYGVKKCFIICSIICLLLFTSTGRDNNSIWAQDKKVLTIISYTDTVRYFIEYFEKQNPDVKIEVTVIPLMDYMDKIIPNLKSGKWNPDLFMGEYANIGELLESGFWENLSAPPYNADVSQMIPFVREVGTDSQGKIRALSYQACVGGVIYRRSVAKKYLGTDDPDKMGKMLETPEKFLETARLVKQKSGGKVKLIAGIGDYYHYPLAARKKSFVTNNKLSIEQPVLDFFEISKDMTDEELTAEINIWSDEWFENMNMAEPKFFAYMLPRWGLHYVMKRNIVHTMGDWGLCKGPESFFWGGDWIGISAKSKQKKLAWEFIRFMILNRDTLKRFARETGDFMSDRIVINQIKHEFTEEMLGGQNYYDFFAEEALKVDGSLMNKYELDIHGYLMDSVNDYIQGNITKQEAIEQFKHDVKDAFPEVNVD